MKLQLLKVSSVVCSCALLAGCADRQMGGSSESSSASMRGSGSGSAARADTQFIKDAGSSGLAEVRMGQLLQQKAQNEQLREFGQQLVQDHSQANQELMALATQNGVEMPSEMKMEDQQSLTRLSAASGQQFDQLAKQEAIKAHQKAIQQFRSAQNRVQDPELKSYIQKTLPVLEQHLQHAQNLSVTSGSGAQGGSEDLESTPSSGAMQEMESTPQSEPTPEEADPLRDSQDQIEQ